MRRLLIASAGCSALFLFYAAAPPLLDARYAVIFEVAATGLLAVMAAVATPRRKLLIAALGFSACGDFLLDIQRLGPLGPKQLFLCGLISFLVAHLFYVAMFVRQRTTTVSVARKTACVAVLAVALISLRVLWPSLGEMEVPVVVYSVVLSTMAIAAQLSVFPAMVAVGALSFVVSDTMLAMSIFGHPFRGSWWLVWVTYYAAQAMIAVGVTGAKRTPEKPS